jgi:alkanesulfonate monooxygenase SsuD/methylene tetrahydromethanopterin reductase-like flavin-dependent oxidoreductase (luciferase family)
VLASHWATYSAAAESKGLRPDRDRWRIARTILVADSDAEAEDYWARPDNTILDYYNYMFTQFVRTNNARVFMATEDSPAEEVSLQAAVDVMVTVGSPKTVTERLVALVDEIGSFGGLLLAFHEWDEEDLWKRSMKLLATDVMPVVSDYAESRLQRARHAH